MLLLLIDVFTLRYYYNKGLYTTNDKRYIVVNMRGNINITKMNIGRKVEYLITDDHQTFAVFCDRYEKDKTQITMHRDERYLGKIWIKGRPIKEGGQ